MTENWQQYTEASHERDARAFEHLRALVPDTSLFHVWANFEFVALDGGAFDVDALVFTPSGVFLIELVTRRGTLQISPRTWLHVHQNGEREPVESPLVVARRKARLLESLVEEFSHGAHAPHIEPVLWIPDPDVVIEGDARALEHIVFHPDALQPDGEPRPSIAELVLAGEGPAVRKALYPLTAVVRQRLAQALEESGIGRSIRHQRYADWRLRELLHAGPRHQDWLVDHVSREDELRRARIFSTPRDSSDVELARLQEAARREFEIVSGLRHPNILAARQHVRSERRPGLLFEHPPGAIRLDQWLDTQQPSVSQKLDILLQVADALRYAHRKSVIHRALTPTSVLILPDGSIRVFNWHTSRKEEVETGTAHVHDYMDDVAQAYLAPELAHSPQAGEEADVYGVGALAFRLFAGAPPATSVAELVNVLVSAGGLRPSRIADGVPESVDDFVYEATRAITRERLKTMTEVIERIESLRRALVIDRQPTLDPLDARPGDILADRFEVVARLGAGSTATALLARTDERDVVLKIANSHTNNKRLKAEGDVLSRLDHRLIVDLFETVELGGRLALVLQSAGDSLYHRLKEGALSLDELRRFGEDLCDILVALEEHAVLHRDIKPANLGIGQPIGSKQRLMIFDFSLADVSLEALDVGTVAYRDPFLHDVGRKRWDEYADRYSAAFTLYEMVTGRLPDWGDGRENPMMDDTAECVVESHLFPASVRERLERFFIRAFQRDFRARFDNAIDMREAWRGVFQTTTQTTHDSIESALREATPQTRVATFGLSPVAQDALDRLDVVTVRDLLALKPQDLQFQRGVSNQIRRELAELRARLVAHFPAQGLAESSDGEDLGDAAQYSVDQLLDCLTGERSRDTKAQRDFIAALLGQRELRDALPWATLDDLAERTERERARFQEEFAALRDRWERKRVLAPLRDDIVRVIDNNEGAISDVELARRVLGLRGSLLREPDERIAAASAVARAAVEAELAAHEPRLFVIRSWTGAVFVLTRDELGDAVHPLGSAADRLVQRDHVISPTRAAEELQRVLDELGVPSMSQLRLLTFAAEASRQATLSSRNELYLRGLPAAEAVKLCAGIFVAGEDFRPEEIQERVRARYPRAEALPGHPELGELLSAAGLKFAWDTARRDGAGAYVNEELDGLQLTRSTRATSLSTGTTLPPSEQFSIRKQFRERLDYKRQYGGFLVMTVSPREAEAARQWLITNHPDLEHVSFDALFLDTLRAKASELEIDLSVVLAADSKANDKEWGNLMQLLRFHVLPAIRENLLARRGDILLTEPGLLARYEDADSMSILRALHEHAGTPEGPRTVLMLVPGDRRHATPEIDGHQIPVLHATEYVQVPVPLS